MVAGNGRAGVTIQTKSTVFELCICGPRKVKWMPLGDVAWYYDPTYIHGVTDLWVDEHLVWYRDRPIVYTWEKSEIIGDARDKKKAKH